jgi:hypothetical protein
VLIRLLQFPPHLFWASSLLCTAFRSVRCGSNCLCVQNPLLLGGFESSNAIETASRFRFSIQTPALLLLPRHISLVSLHARKRNVAMYLHLPLPLLVSEAPDDRPLANIGRPCRPSHGPDRTDGFRCQRNLRFLSCLLLSFTAFQRREICRRRFKAFLAPRPSAAWRCLPPLARCNWLVLIFQGCCLIRDH